MTPSGHSDRQPDLHSGESDFWSPQIGDLVWTNHPDGDCQGKVVGFVEDGQRKGQPIIEAQEGVDSMFLKVKAGDKHVCHPMFLLPFPFGSREWKRAQAEGRVVQR